MRLLIGIPTGGTPARPFIDALSALELPASVTAAERVVWTGNFVPAQREMIVRDALRLGADFVAMLDDDIVAPPDALVRLLDVLERDAGAAIAGALYYSRDSLRPMAVSRWTSGDTTSAAIPAFAEEPVDVDGVGFGCVVVRVAALRSLALPYFAAQVYVEPATRTVRQCNEDYLLCERLRGAGFRVVLHAGVRAGHYDRALATLAPVTWESPEQTAHARMIVRGPLGKTLVPFDDALPRVAEPQEAIPVTLVFASDEARA